MSYRNSVNSESPPLSVHEDNELSEVKRVTTSGTRNEYVHLGDQKYLRSDLEYAFGGRFTTGLNVRPHLKLGNASPMALIAFAATTIMLSLIQAGARSIKNYTVMVGSALFYGGALQIIAGFWELLLENTFAGTVFASYGGFWMTFSTLQMGGFNIESSYESQKEWENAQGIFTLVWAFLSLLFTICTIRSTVPMFSLIFSVMMVNICSTAAHFSNSIGEEVIGGRCLRASGVFGVLAGFLALWNAMAGLLNKENSYMRIAPLYMPGAIRPSSEIQEA